MSGLFWLGFPPVVHWLFERLPFPPFPRVSSCDTERFSTGVSLGKVTRRGSRTGLDHPEGASVNDDMRGARLESVFDGRTAVGPNLSEGLAGGYWARRPQVSARLSGEYAILFDPDTGKERALNRAGLVVWDAMDGAADARQLANALASEFDGPSSQELYEDAAGLARDLEYHGFATRSTVPADPPAPRETHFSSADAPREIDISLTGSCNLRCSYCFYSGEMARRDDLATETWISFFDELRQHAVRKVTLSGGEVFIRRDLWHLVDAVVDARLRYSFLSNGTRITEASIAALSQESRRRRLDSVQVSLDGASAAVHDVSRGEGSFDRALRGLRLLIEARLPVTVRVTINHQNLGELEDTAVFLLDHLRLPGFSCNEAVPLGTSCERLGETALTPVEQLAAMKVLEKLAARYPGRIQASAGPLAKLRTYREMERALATGWRSDGWRMGVLSACGCAFGKLAVHHDGTYAPCNMLDLELGRVTTHRLSDVWRSRGTLAEMRARQQVATREIPGCSDCAWVPVCNGSCPATGYSRTGTLMSVNLDDCYRRFLAAIGDEERRCFFAWDGEGRNVE